VIKNEGWGHFKAASAKAPHPLPESNQIVSISEQEQAEIRLEFARLKQDHADFDAAINAMIASGCDPLQIQRMKKKKLALKDRIQELEDRIIPDIIA
jgi:hypothetical protein